jgi:hypothetical protein
MILGIMASRPRRPVIMVPAAAKDKKRRCLDQQAEEINADGFSSVTTTVNYETVHTASGPELQEVAYDIPAPVLPVPQVSLPEVIEDVTWTHDDPAAPLAQFGSTTYVTAATASSGPKAARVGEPSVVRSLVYATRACVCANTPTGVYEQVEGPPQRVRQRAPSSGLAGQHVPQKRVLCNMPYVVWCFCALHGLLLWQGAMQQLHVY